MSDKSKEEFDGLTNSELRAICHQKSVAAIAAEERATAALRERRLFGELVAASREAAARAEAASVLARAEADAAVSKSDRVVKAAARRVKQLEAPQERVLQLEAKLKELAGEIRALRSVNADKDEEIMLLNYELRKYR
jgi:hypothetical protein